MALMAKLTPADLKLLRTLSPAECLAVAETLESRAEAYRAYARKHHKGKLRELRGRSNGHGPNGARGG